jgi:CRISPR-associated protein Cmr4
MDNAIIVGFLAETELHPGAGQGLGTIDQPVQREGGSKFPVVPGTSYKGTAKSELLDASADTQLKRIFGEAGSTGTSAGTVAFGDIRLLLLPMRCSGSAYKWVTTPLLLERFERDARRAKLLNVNSLAVASPPADQVFTAGDSRLYIEEFQFSVKPLPANITEIARCIGNLLPADHPYDRLKQRLASQLLIMNDDDFAWFCEYGLPVRPHNALDENKASENFWYEEYLPADTVMYALNTARSSNSGDLNRYSTELASRKWLQLGGNETTGEGVCRIQVWKS